MVYEFRAHKPRTYFWFALSLVAVIFLNAFLIQSLHTTLLNWNDWIQHSVIFIVPWILFLFLPSVFTGLAIYYSLVNRYCFTLGESDLKIQRMNSKKNPIGPVKIFEWKELKEFRFSDFEDNQYFTLVFHDKKNNLIIHRSSGNFESFFEELKKYVN